MYNISVGVNVQVVTPHLCVTSVRHRMSESQSCCRPAGGGFYNSLPLATYRCEMALNTVDPPRERKKSDVG